METLKTRYAIYVQCMIDLDAKPVRVRRCRSQIIEHLGEALSPLGGGGGCPQGLPMPHHGT